MMKVATCVVLIADINALKKFYGQGFKEKSIPKNPNVEQIDKNQAEFKSRDS